MPFVRANLAYRSKIVEVAVVGDRCIGVMLESANGTTALVFGNQEAAKLVRELTKAMKEPGGPKKGGDDLG